MMFTLITACALTDKVQNSMIIVRGLKWELLTL